MPRNNVAEVDGEVHVRPVADEGVPPVIVGEATLGLLGWLQENEPFDPADIARLREESINVLAGCLRSTRSGRRTGLICGYVQSGKTASIETVSALARDNGYRILVLLAGVTTNLVEQSASRMTHLRLGAGGYAWVMLRNPTIRNRAELESLVHEWRSPSSSALQQSRTLFVSVMKQADHLQHLTDLLGSISLRGVPTIIFDDEADQASLNTRPLDPTPSTIYTRIRDLRATLPSHTLLQYTATPQAPLLISRIDALSADFAEVISPGRDYTGGSIFFRERKADLVREIPPGEIIDPRNLPSAPPPTLMEALATYYVGVAVAYATAGPAGPSKNRSMLIHPHQTRPVHDWCLRAVERVQRDWAAILSTPDEPDRPGLLRIFRAAHADLSATHPGVPEFEAIEAALIPAIRRTATRLVNSNDGREVDWTNNYSHILVGGEKLGRGYTVKGLTVTYMPRGPGQWNADTVQQRARFFGYHREYLGLCRVYLHPDIADIYTDYLVHEEDVRSKIQAHRGRKLQDLKRAFYLEASQRPTRHNVLTRLYLRPGGADWFEQRWPHGNPTAAINNTRLANRLKRSLRLTPHATYPQHRGALVKLHGLLENFLAQFACSDDRDETNLYAIVTALGAYLREEPEADCMIFVMDDGQDPRDRQQSPRLKDINVQQGRSSAGAARYPGDKHFADPSLATVQLHRIRVREPGPRGRGAVVADDVCALAIHLPDSLRGRLQDVIVQPSN